MAHLLPQYTGDEEQYWGDGPFDFVISKLEKTPAGDIVDRRPGRFGRVTQRDIEQADLLETLRRARETLKT